MKSPRITSRPIDGAPIWKPQPSTHAVFVDIGLSMVMGERTQERVELAGLRGIYQELRPELLRFLTARTGDRGEAEDLAQELWLKIAAQPVGPVGNSRAYLYRAAQNLVLDRARARQRRMRRDGAWAGVERGVGLEPSDPSPDAEADLISREETAALASAINQLPPAAGRAFRLHKLEGFSHAEVATQLGISRSGVEKHIAVAMAHLRRSLQD